MENIPLMFFMNMIILLVTPPRVPSAKHRSNQGPPRAGRTGLPDFHEYSLFRMPQDGSI